MARVVEARVGCSIPYAEGVDSSRDPCAVHTDGLASIVDRFVSDYGRRAGASDDVLTGAIQELVKRTQQADPTGRGVSDKTIRSVMKGTYATTDLRTADFLVIAARRPFAFHDGTLNVIQNERASKAVRRSCCGTSSRDALNGSL